MHDDLGMRKLCAKVVPKILTREQKEHRVNCCDDTLENIENYTDFFPKRNYVRRNLDFFSI